MSRDPAINDGGFYSSSLFFVSWTDVLTSSGPGGPFAVSRLRLEDLRAGVVKAPWLPKLAHPAIPEETHRAVGPQIVSGVLQGLAAGEWESSDAWNRLLPDFKFTRPEEFLTKAWAAIDAGAEGVVPFDDY